MVILIISSNHLALACFVPIYFHIDIPNWQGHSWFLQLYHVTECTLAWRRLYMQIFTPPPPPTMLILFSEQNAFLFIIASVYSC